MRPRIRTVKPEFFTDQDLYLAEKESGLPIRLSFEGLWCCSDREGRFPWKPMELKAHILPFEDVNFSRVLDVCATRGFVVRYASGGRDYGWIPNFKRHQAINNRESASELPEPPTSDVPPETSTRAPHVEDASPTPLCPAQAEGNGIGREPDPPVVPPGRGTAHVRRKGRHREEVKAHQAEVFAPVEGQTAARIDREQFRRAGAEFVFAYWAKKLHHPSALFDEKRETRIHRAHQENHDKLSEHCYVVDGVLLDPWEGRRQQDDILVIMRDRTHIEKLAGLCPGYRASKPHPVVAHLGAEDSHAEEVPAEVAGVGA